MAYLLSLKTQIQPAFHSEVSIVDKKYLRGKVLTTYKLLLHIMFPKQSVGQYSLSLTLC